MLADDMSSWERQAKYGFYRIENYDFMIYTRVICGKWKLVPEMCKL